MSTCLRLVLVVNETKPAAVQTGLEIAAWCRVRGIECVEAGPSTAVLPDDVVCALGGDGTVLRAAARAAEAGAPVLGVNVGSLGFLSPTSLDALLPTMESIAAGRYEVERRMRLAFQGGSLAGTALNDLVVAAAAARLVEMRLHWGAEPAVTLRGDGMIFSTPTGTTAYSLSLGGPIAVPTAEGIVVMAHAAHVLGMRPLLFSRDDEVRVTASASVRLIADGDEIGRVPAGTDVVVRRAATPTTLVRPVGAKGFFATLADKLNWPGAERRHDEANVGR